MLTSRCRVLQRVEQDFEILCAFNTWKILIELLLDLLFIDIVCIQWVQDSEQISWRFLIETYCLRTIGCKIRMDFFWIYHWEILCVYIEFKLLMGFLWNFQHSDIVYVQGMQDFNEIYYEFLIHRENVLSVMDL